MRGSMVRNNGGEGIGHVRICARHQKVDKRRQVTKEINLGKPKLTILVSHSVQHKVNLSIQFS